MRNTLILALLFPAVSFAATLDVAGIDAALGAKGKWNDAEKAYRVEFRYGSWATFQTGKEKPSIMLGEFVLTGTEVNPAIDAALAGGLEVMALHSSSLDAQQRNFSLHVSGEGEAPALAEALKKVRDAIDAVKVKDRSRPAQASDMVELITIPREAVMPCGCKISSAMGVATTAKLRLERDQSQVSGSVPCAYGEVPSVLKALRGGGLEITAIVNHIDAEAPRLLFVHFSGSGPSEELRKTIKAAVAAQSDRGGAHQHHQH